MADFTRFRLPRLAALGALSLLSWQAAAQVAAQTTPAQRWQHLDQQADGVPGLSTDRAYRELLAGRTPTLVRLAVLDSGIDSTHEDLKAILWRNPKEIAGNGLDDDHNGYADDVRGWNFLGGKNGQSVAFETLEQTRLYAQLRPQFEGKKRKNLPPAEQAQFDVYEAAKTSFEQTRQRDQQRLTRLSEALAANEKSFERAQQDLGGISLDTATLHRLARTQPAPPHVVSLYAFLRKNGVVSTDAALADLRKAVERFHNRLEKNLNPDYNPRPAVVGDDLANLAQRDYGNADSQGPDASHGTHCAGIIGGQRGNERGPDGVADAVRIMSVRSTPSGDERDKDVANAIRYAVDNGAQIISMSFGKDFSPQKAAVDEAMRYAAAHDVLLVHAAGNDAHDNDLGHNFPAARFLDGQLVPNLITVGASSRDNSAKLVAEFSNYGRQTVDVFAPGVDIYSCAPANAYATESGTSMAGPMVAGVAAVLKAYYPQLSAVQLKDIIERSAVPYHTRVPRPGSQTLVDFASLSRTGGIANLYAALQLAAQLTAASK